MSTEKIKISVNNHKYEDGSVYVSIGLDSGFACRDYMVSEEEVFIGNYAFCNILFNYLQQEIEDVMEFLVERTSSVITFRQTKEKYMGKLAFVLEKIFEREYSEKKFEEAKQISMDNMAANYKDESFRARFRALEFADAGKDFFLKNMITDLEKIDYSTFVMTADAIVIPDNIYIYVNGETEGIDQKIDEVLAVVPESDKEAKMMFISKDPYLKTDGYATGLGKRDYTLDVITFDFPGEEIPSILKRMIVDIENERVAAENKEVHVDFNDASIISEITDDEQRKGSMEKPIGEKAFEEAKQNVLKRIALMIKQYPDIFCREAVKMSMNDVPVDMYMNILKEYSYEEYTELYRRADVLVHEGAVVIRKETANVQ